MKKIVSTWILLSSVLALALSFVAFAHAAEEPAGGSMPENKDRPALRGARALGPFGLFDTNQDGSLSSEEINQASAALRKLDKNGDGSLTGNELRPGRPPRNRDDEGGRGDGDTLPPPR
jgi:hypothetical protein